MQVRILHLIVHFLLIQCSTVFGLWVPANENPSSIKFHQYSSAALLSISCFQFRMLKWIVHLLTAYSKLVWIGGNKLIGDQIRVKWEKTSVFLLGFCCNSLSSFICIFLLLLVANVYVWLSQWGSYDDEEGKYDACSWSLNIGFLSPWCIWSNGTKQISERGGADLFWYMLKDTVAGLICV